MSPKEKSEFIKEQYAKTKRDFNSIKLLNKYGNIQSAFSGTSKMNLDPYLARAPKICSPLPRGSHSLNMKSVL